MGKGSKGKPMTKKKRAGKKAQGETLEEVAARQLLGIVLLYLSMEAL